MRSNSLNIEEYNQLIEEWNERFGYKAPLQRISSDDMDIQKSITSRLYRLFCTQKMTFMGKIRTNRTICQEFSKLQTSPTKTDTSQLSKSDLAQLIAFQSKRIQKQQSLFSPSFF